LIKCEHHEEEEGQRPVWGIEELMIGIVDGEEWKWEIKYEEHYLQQLRRKRDSTTGSNKSYPPSLSRGRRD